MQILRKEISNFSDAKIWTQCINFGNQLKLICVYFIDFFKSIYPIGWAGKVDEMFRVWTAN
jgi:hypothetical protein